MSILLLFLTVCAGGVQSAFAKKYSQKENCGKYIFYGISTFFALPAFVIQDGFRFDFTQGVIMYSIIFAAAYCSTLIFQFIALKNGPISLTVLINSYSLIIPTFYGIIFLHEPFTVSMAVGLALLAVSLYMTVGIKTDKGKINLKWLLCVAVAFFANGACSTVQKIQQTVYDGRYKGGFMIAALLIVFLVLMLFSFIFEKDVWVRSVKSGWYLAAPLGIANSLVNLFVLILSNTVPASVMFPIISAGGVVTSSVIGIAFFKEKLSGIQLAGVAVGIISIIFLSI